MVQSAAVSSAEPSSYRSLLAGLREHARAYIAKQLLLPRQEIRELIMANLRAVAWMGGALGLLFFFGIACVVLLVALLAKLPRDWLGLLVLALVAGLAAALVFAAIRRGGGGLVLGAVVAALVMVALGSVAYLFASELVLAATLLCVLLVAGAGALAYQGYRSLQLRGPERSIRSVKETISWVKATLHGRSES